VQIKPDGTLTMSPRLLFLALALALLAGCPKAKPPPEQVPDEEPASKKVIGIDSVTPSSTALGRAVTVTVKGFGFVKDTDVFLDSRRARGIDIVSTNELTFRATDDLPAASYDVRLETPKGDVAVARKAFTVEAAPEASSCELKTVYFDFDDAGLKNESREVLAANARCIEERALVGVRLEGHADERGSTEYNLSLGQRRADSVRQYLENLGLNASDLRTVSYGEERPEDNGSGEAAWARNRRVVFALR
jgi:peptidoglycan-associated lipoprotein